MTTAEELQALDELNKVSYALTVPPLALWIGILARVLVLKDMRKLT